MKDSTSWLLTSAMKDVIKKGSGKLLRWEDKNFKMPVAGKTGTSQNYRDAWFAGWTNKYVAVVWVGNDNDKPMNKIGGGSLPAQIWHDIMATTVGETPSSDVMDSIGDLIESEEGDGDEIGDLISKTSGESPSTSDDTIGALIEGL